MHRVKIRNSRKAGEGNRGLHATNGNDHWIASTAKSRLISPGSTQTALIQPNTKQSTIRAAAFPNLNWKDVGWVVGWVRASKKGGLVRKTVITPKVVVELKVINVRLATAKKGGGSQK